LPALLRGENSFNLLEMIEIVAGKHPDDGFYGLRAALIVHAAMLPLFGRERLEQLASMP
jgi:hypothetical protein